MDIVLLSHYVWLDMFVHSNWSGLCRNICGCWAYHKRPPKRLLSKKHDYGFVCSNFGVCYPPYLKIAPPCLNKLIFIYDKVLTCYELCYKWPDKFFTVIFNCLCKYMTYEYKDSKTFDQTILIFKTWLNPVLTEKC